MSTTLVNGAFGVAGKVLSTAGRLHIHETQSRGNPDQYEGVLDPLGTEHSTDVVENECILTTLSPDDTLVRSDSAPHHFFRGSAA